MNQAELISVAKETLAVSQNEIARRVGARDSEMSAWANLRRSMPDAYIAAVAKLAGLDPIHALADVKGGPYRLCIM